MAINARRVIFSSYVVPSEVLEMEEASITHTVFHSMGRWLGIIFT